mgnify:FL=1
MEKNVEISLLFGFYKNLLTARQADTVDLYYNEDLSLAEIGEELGISRQGVRDNLKRAEQLLYDAEEKLGLAKRFIEIRGKLGEIDIMIKEIEGLAEANRLPADIRKKINAVLETLSDINGLTE